MQEERCPADHEDPNQDGQGDGTLHVGPLLDGARTREDGNPLNVQPGHEEHVHIERSHERQHGEEHGDETDDHGVAVGINDEQDARHGASCPDTADDDAHPLHRHNVMVLESVKDGEIPVHGNGKQAADGGQQGAADHRVDDIVNIHRETLGVCVGAVQEGDDYGFRAIGNAHQHVSYSQAADEKVHGRVQILVLGDGHDHQDVLQQTDDPQGHEDFGRDKKLLIASCIQVGFPQGLAGIASCTIGAVVPEVMGGVHPVVRSGIHLKGMQPLPGREMEVG